MIRRRFKIELILLYLATCAAQFEDDMQKLEPACYEEGAFFCLGGGCVPSDKYCDGIYDCRDGSDENFCPSHPPDAQYCNQTHQFLCSDGRRCVPATWVCNTEVDCDDGSDELNCSTPHAQDNSTCKGYACDGSRCISPLWMCDGKYDCHDKSDEDIQNTCRHALHDRKVNDGHNCPSGIPRGAADVEYPCLDSSFCIPHQRMCDGLADCRDGSDEGTFCSEWHTMCSNHSCGADGFCVPARSGPACQCPPLRQYNGTSGRCEDADQCQLLAPVCSHQCLDRGDHFVCQCDAGYFPDYTQYLCFAPDPEPILFFSTPNHIRYIKVKSKEQGTISSEVKKAHGVSFDGTFVYWVERAEGHQSISRARFGNVTQTKQVVAALGLSEPADVAVDHLGGNIYFSDADRHAVAACRADGSACATLQTNTVHPRFITLNTRRGEMYWADWNDKPVIYVSKMDGQGLDYLVRDLESFATGLALDASNDRLYFVDQTIKVVRLSDKKVYTLFNEPFHQPYALAVFENTVYWSDWTSNTVQTSDKIHGATTNRRILLTLDEPVFDMHIYHPVLMSKVQNPCARHSCSHLCLITGPETHACACPDGMQLHGDECVLSAGYRPRYLVLGAGAALGRVDYSALGSADAARVLLDLARLQAMAYDCNRDALYIYDGWRKSIVSLNMSDFQVGALHLFMHEGKENVIDMEFDFVSDNLYVLDATRRVIEVLSVRNKMRAFVHLFHEREMPLSFCVIPQHGLILVAVMENEDTNSIYVDSMGMDGSDRKRFPLTNLIGPYIRMRYSPEVDLVYFSDDGRKVIETIHPTGTGREVFCHTSTGVASLSVSDTHVFWSDHRASRLYWAHTHDSTQRVRRLELAPYSNVTHLHTLTTSPPPDTSAFRTHACFSPPTPCSHVCVQRYHPTLSGLEYQCLCPPGLFLDNTTCVERAVCASHELYCHKSNACFSHYKKCDGTKDCVHGEDEIGCSATTESHVACDWDQTNCHGTCISKTSVCKDNLPSKTTDVTTAAVVCSPTQLRCGVSDVCVERALACDNHEDCADGSDEDPALCGTLTCLDHEFMCDSGSCVPVMWRCDRFEDCQDGSDEFGCPNSTCPEGQSQCDNGDCVQLSQLCDGTANCADGSDEDDCKDTEELSDAVVAKLVPTCQPWEFVCEHNKSICLPYTARCNGKVECPGRSDEDGCDVRCAPSGGFGCAQEYRCIGLQHVCNGWRDCSDGSDETLDACARVNRTSAVLHKAELGEECRGGYRCSSGACVDWSQVCDEVTDCADGSDEGGACASSCALNCNQTCQRSPTGGRCVCGAGYEARGAACDDVDECAARVCSHTCRNLPGAFLCSCHPGYTLRPDGRSCKVPSGEVTALYTSGAAVWALSRHRYHDLVYRDPHNHTVSDIGYNVRKEKLYIASFDGGKLVEVIRKMNTNVVVATNVVTNIGKPTRLSVDWVTDNVYLVDGSPEAPHLRVCHVARNSCAKLKRLSPGTEVTALAVDPTNQLLFYCVSRARESEVRATNLSGRSTLQLAGAPSCAGLAPEPHSRTLYIASPANNAILQINYEGNALLTVLNLDRHIRAPHGLALFEDHVYFLSDGGLNRCQLFSGRACDTWARAPAYAFLLHHNSTQLEAADACAGACVTVCVPAGGGHACVCPDGSAPTSGQCVAVPQSEVALFNGRLHLASRSHPVSITLVVLVVLLFVVYLIAFVRFQRRQRKANARGSYLQVRYDNAAGLTEVATPIVGAPSTSESGHEFVNPLQFVRNVWRDSFRGKPRPIGTAGLVIDMQQDLSDTESDLDIRENKRLFN